MTALDYIRDPISPVQPFKRASFVFPQSPGMEDIIHTVNPETITTGRSRRASSRAARKKISNYAMEQGSDDGGKEEEEDDYKYSKGPPPPSPPSTPLAAPPGSSSLSSSSGCVQFVISMFLCYVS